MLGINDANRIRNVQFEYLEEIDILFDKAAGFYQGVRARDELMLQNIEKRLKETGETKAVVVTGGFHAKPFTEFFKRAGYSYALVSSKITSSEGRDAYVRAFFKKGLPVSSARLTAKPSASGPSLKRSAVEALLGVEPLGTFDIRNDDVYSRIVRAEVRSSREYSESEDLIGERIQEIQRRIDSLHTRLAPDIYASVPPDHPLFLLQLGLLYTSRRFLPIASELLDRARGYL